MGGVAVGLRRRAGRLRRRGGARLRAPRGSRSPAPDAGHRDRGLALAAYVLDLPPARDGRLVPRLVLQIPFGDVYLHDPGRLRYVAVLALPILAAAGLQGLGGAPCLTACGARLARRREGSRSSLWPLLGGRNLVRFAMVAAILVAAAPLLYGIATRRWRWASASAVVGVCSPSNCWASAVYAQSYEGGTIFTGLETGDHPEPLPQVLRYPDAGRRPAYLAPTPIVRAHPSEPGRYGRGHHRRPTSRRATSG